MLVSTALEKGFFMTERATLTIYVCWDKLDTGAVRYTLTIYNGDVKVAVTLRGALNGGVTIR